MVLESVFLESRQRVWELTRCFRSFALAHECSMIKEQMGVLHTVLHTYSQLQAII